MNSSKKMTAQQAYEIGFHAWAYPGTPCVLTGELKTAWEEGYRAREEYERAQAALT